MLSADAIIDLHDQRTRAWHLAPENLGEPAPSSINSNTKLDWLGLVACQHGANFDLWHIEDEARAPGAMKSWPASAAASTPTISSSISALIAICTGTAAARSFARPTPGTWVTIRRS